MFLRTGTRKADNLCFLQVHNLHFVDTHTHTFKQTISSRHCLPPALSNAQRQTCHYLLCCFWNSQNEQAKHDSSVWQIRDCSVERYIDVLFIPLPRVCLSVCCLCVCCLCWWLSNPRALITSWCVVESRLNTTAIARGTAELLIAHTSPEKSHKGKLFK